MGLYNINNNLEIYELPDGRHMVFNRYTKKSFALGEDEFSVLIRIDGLKSTEDLEKDSIFSKSQIETLLLAFERMGFLDSSEVKRKINITKLSVRILNPNRMLKTGGRVVKVLSACLLFGTLPMLAIAVALNVILEANFFYIINDIFLSVQTPSFLVFWPITLVVTFLHEMGHAVVAKRYSVNVPEMGVMLYWFMPAAYVNLTGVTLLSEKKKRILIYLSGIFMNLFLLALVLLIRPFISQGFQFLVSWFVLNTLLSLIFNLFIFLKLDGYLIFKELVEIKELRERAFEYLLRKIKKPKRAKLGNQRFPFYIQYDMTEYTEIQRGTLICYSLLSIMFIPFLLLSIGIPVLTAIF